jgi:hypothetical protein
LKTFCVFAAHIRHAGRAHPPAKKARRTDFGEEFYMHIYQQLYEFAASAGAFEGYVYRRSKTEIDTDVLSSWVGNLVDAYKNLSSEVRDECQSSIDQTLGRAIKSLASLFDDRHALVNKLQKIVKGELPGSPDDFQKQKWFQD